MDAGALRAALHAFARTLREPVELVLGGSAALVLAGELHRQTADSDVVQSVPDLGQLQEQIRATETSEHLPPGWLNGSIQSYVHVLPPDFRTRCVALPPFVAPKRLRVLLVSRRDVIVMKVYAQRARDLDDLEALRPTVDEWALVDAQVPRIATFEPDQAARMQALGHAWDARVQRTSAATDDRGPRVTPASDTPRADPESPTPPAFGLEE